MKEEIEWFRPEDKLPESNKEQLLLHIKSIEHLEWDDVTEGKFLKSDGLLESRFFDHCDCYDFFEKDKDFVNTLINVGVVKLIAWAEMPKGIKI